MCQYFEYLFSSVSFWIYCFDYKFGNNLTIKVIEKCRSSFCTTCTFILWKVGDEIVRVNGYTIAEAVHEEVLNLIKGRDEIELKVTSRCTVHFYILIILITTVSECDILICLDIMKDDLKIKRIQLKKNKITIYLWCTFLCKCHWGELHYPSYVS